MNAQRLWNYLISMLKSCNISNINFTKNCIRKLINTINNLHVLSHKINDKKWKYNLQLKNK